MYKLLRLNKICAVCLIMSLITCNVSITAQNVTSYQKVTEDNEESIQGEIEDFYTVSFSMEAVWQNHYNGKITIKNVSQNTIHNWEVSFISQDNIETIWCAS